MKCEFDGQYGKDENDNLFFWCIHCGKKRGLEELGEVECEDCTKELIQKSVKAERERVVDYISFKEGWEETGDKYREYFNLKTRYK